MTAILAIAVVLLPGLLLRWWRKGNRATNRRRTVLTLVAAILGLQAFFGAPAFADEDVTCVASPDYTNSGLVGVIDPLPHNGEKGSVYDDFGYAGLVWHTYDPHCSNPINAAGNTPQVVDTWMGNQIFNVSKAIVATTNALHFSVTNDLLKGPLDQIIPKGAEGLYRAVFVPLVGLAALLLGIFIFRHVWQGDFATISKRGMWALVGLWMASITIVSPALYSDLFDDVIINGTAQIQNGFLQETNVYKGNPSESNGNSAILPTMLHDQIVYQGWLLGQFGSRDDGSGDTAQEAKDQGRPLLENQVITPQDTVIARSQNKSLDQLINDKKTAYTKIDEKLQASQPYSRGTAGSRIGAGFLSLFNALIFSFFQLVAKAAILLAQVLLRVIILLSPLIGLIAILFHDIIRKIALAAATVLFNVFALAVLAGAHFLIINLLFDQVKDLTLRMALATLITLIFLIVARPVRRMWQMIDQSVHVFGNGAPGKSKGLFGRWLRRSEAGEATPQEAFWENVRHGDGGSGRHQQRAEAGLALAAGSSTPAALSAGSSAGQLDSGSTPAVTGRRGNSDSGGMTDYAGRRRRNEPEVLEGLVIASQVHREDREPPARRAVDESTDSSRTIMFSPSRGFTIEQSSTLYERPALTRGDGG